MFCSFPAWRLEDFLNRRLDVFQQFEEILSDYLFKHCFCSIHSTPSQTPSRLHKRCTSYALLCISHLFLFHNLASISSTVLRINSMATLLNFKSLLNICKHIICFKNFIYLPGFISPRALRPSKIWTACSLDLVHR